MRANRAVAHDATSTAFLSGRHDGILVPMTTMQTEPRICACGCGEPVIGSRKPPGEPVWKRGHKLRSTGGKLTSLPGPDDNLDSEDLDAGEAYPDDQPPELGDDLPDWLLNGSDGPPAPEEPEITADRPPGRISEPRTSGKRSGKANTRVTANLRKDVEAKIRFVLMPAGQAWSIRDQICGGTFLQQEPEISAALAEIVCDSPDLLAWFTGPAGGFMKYFRLLMAIQPVAMTAWAHHARHAQFMPADPNQPPQQQAYAA
jgi:hypothetical protein